jgi:hypothetical protein
METARRLLTLTDTLVQDVLLDNKKLKHVLALLYDTDMEKRFSAARALGEIGARNPSLIEHKWRRIYAACDDTMSCWGVGEALGEIARAMPELRKRIILLLGKFYRDECTCQGYLWALARIGRVDRYSIAEQLPNLERALYSANICLVGQALWSVGELEITEATERVQKLTSDDREMWLYENDAVRVKKVGIIATEALEKITGSRIAGF